jgi:hypothetical protein
MPQPPGAPPDKWERRQDDRRAIALTEGLNALAEEVRKLDLRETAHFEARKTELEHYLSGKAAIAFLLTFLGLNVTVLGLIYNASQNDKAAMRTEHAQRLQEMRQEHDAWVKKWEWMVSEIDRQHRFETPQKKKGKQP